MLLSLLEFYFIHWSHVQGNKYANLDTKASNLWLFLHSCPGSSLLGVPWVAKEIKPVNSKGNQP